MCYRDKAIIFSEDSLELMKLSFHKVKPNIKSYGKYKKFSNKTFRISLQENVVTNRIELGTFIGLFNLQ